jgi:TonB family protein
MSMRRFRLAAAAAVLAALVPAHADTRIDVRRLLEVRPGMTAEQVHATIGQPDITMMGPAPGPIDLYDFLFTQWEKDGLYAGGPGMASYGADGRLLGMVLPPLRRDAGGAAHSTPYGDSATLEPFARLDAYATEPAWGYDAAHPIRVGGLRRDSLPQSEGAFLNALRGPADEVVEYEREGSCCAFDTPNGIGGHGFLDVFRVTIQGRPAPVRLYLDMYDPGPRDVPAGFAYRLKEVTLRNLPLAAPATVPSAPALTGTPLVPAGVATPARLDRTHCTPPPWPPQSLAERETGTVSLQVQVRPDGSAKETSLARSSGHPRLDEASLLGFAACRYVPATRDGQPVAGSVAVDYTWKLP